jgi:RNA polymerase sigma-70 factor (ECF subfamily)
MVVSPREELEERLVKLLSARDYRAVATLGLRSYGPEIHGFLRASLSSADDPDEAFSEFAEAVWKSLPSFRCTSAVRTWMYGVARNILRVRGRERLRRRSRIADGGESIVEEIAEEVRSVTASFLRTEKRTRFHALREALPEEDRMLLVLRVDRDLKWDELARIFLCTDDDASYDEADLVREAARLRKRLQLVKRRLKEMARREGLLEGD